MVDHKYLGRGGKAKQYLSDPEVRRLHEKRRATEVDGLTRLQHQFGRDPVPPGIREQAHLFLLAEPAAGRHGMLLDLVHGPGLRDRLSKFARAPGPPEIQQVLEAAGAASFTPLLSWATDFALRSAGVTSLMLLVPAQMPERATRAQQAQPGAEPPVFCVHDGPAGDL
jgi:hypothetical protein